MPEDIIFNSNVYTETSSQVSLYENAVQSEPCNVNEQILDRSERACSITGMLVTLQVIPLALWGSCGTQLAGS